jgi:hypothetical protein
MGSSPYGCEECFSSWCPFKGDLHGAVIGVHSKLVFSMQNEEVTNFTNYDSSLLLTHANDSSRVCHEGFGHLNFRYMQRLSMQGMVKGLRYIHFSKGVCEGCILGKHHEEKFEKGKARRASSSLELVHSDLMGPFPHSSINKARYVLTFIDDYSS